uniref:Glycosyl transferase 64 domain-containing protein n=1 Tax=Grammatophora oceanica TaxID=210454 RepID=A0A7S1YF03_9STRA|mmetsp:Transcript_47168/g.70168  ORF Transcript_47168/g.70168 Transcript_47168/m.70168 type:complete len:486 (+) Transcript_47168:59-1516(+)
MVEINLKSLAIGMLLGVLLCSNVSNSFCNSPFSSATFSSAVDDAPSGDDPSATATAAAAASPPKAHPAKTDSASPPEKFTPDAMFQTQYDEIDNEDIEKKCARYNLKYNPSSPERRVFFGSMIANDAIQMLKMHATEVYDLYDVMVLVESNTTHMATPREMRFIPGKEGYEFMYSGAWGPNTKIRMSYWLEERPDLMYMSRERTQRNTIVQGWVAEGMTENDIAIMSDMDETFTRDYLLAIKKCEPPDHILAKDCKKVKLLGSSLVFQSSPECISQRNWYHPDWTLGQCMQGVGDASIRVPRKYKSDKSPACGGGNYCSDGRQDLYDADQIKDGMYPLLSGTDLRELPQGNMATVWNRDDEHTTTAFHFHNMFADLVKLRDKYATYAHGSFSMVKRPLGEIEQDLDVVVRCSHGYPNDINPEGRLRYEEGFEKYKGSKPIYFANSTYRKERHTDLIRMMAEDEAKWGKTYNESFVSQYLHAAKEK